MTPQLEFRPGLADVPAAESAISFIDGKRARLEYRGVAVETLARESCFEETAWLLLKGELPTQRELAQFDHDLRHHRRIKYKLIELIKCLPEHGHPMDALQASVAAMGMFYPAHNVTDPAHNWLSVVRLIAKMPTVVAAFHRLRHGDYPIKPRDDLDHAANFYYMLFEQEPAPAVRKVIDACLILHAEHTMNASTFSARVTGSTLADPFTVISSAIGTLSGPLHGGANEEVLVMLEEVKNTEDVKPWLQKKLAADPKFKIMGMGHRVYKVKDPRATVLQELAEQAFTETSRPKKYDTAGQEGRLPERGLLLRQRLRVARHPARPVHADLRDRPRRRLAGPLAGAAQEQPDLPPRTDPRRQTRRGVRATGETPVTEPV
jgi:citrate synthase